MHKIQSSALSLVLILSPLFLSEQAQAASLIGQPCNAATEVGVTKLDLNRTGVVGCFIKEEGSADAVWKSSFPTVPQTIQRRYVFTASQSWQVPKGVTSGFITMAGGGGSGFGWRVSNAHISGHSGGYVFSHPVVLVPEETLTIEVGKGATGYSPQITATPVVGFPGYRVWVPPAGDTGLGGYPGKSSKVTSATNGVLLECTGGSGAVHDTGFDTLSGGTPIPGPQNGATFGSGLEPIPNPDNRLATGAYSLVNSPGACGPSNYGRGNYGQTRWTTESGEYIGGMTPFGYGSGGTLMLSGCYVSPTQSGRCAFAYDGRDGVVIIDVMY